MTEEPKKERDNQQKQKKLAKQAAAAQPDEEDEDEVPEVESRIQVPQKGAKGNEQKPRAQPRQTEVQPRQQAEVQPRQTQAQQKVAGRPSETLSRGQPQSQLRVAGSPSETLSKVQPQTQPRVAGSPSETLARGQPQSQPRPESRKTQQQQQQQQQQQKRRQQALQQQDEEDEDDNDDYPAKDSKPFRIRVKKCSDFKRDPNFEVVRKRLKDDKNKALKTLVDSVVQSPPDLCMALSVNSDMDNVSFHKDRFEVIVDARNFDAEDIVCVVKGQEIEISAEKKSSSCSGAVTGRLMKRMYSLPQPINPEYSTCFLSKDGLLVLSAPWNS